jgi:voltage-gated potassium channel
VTVKPGESRASITLRLIGRRLGRIGVPFVAVLVVVAVVLYFLEHDLPGTHFEHLSDGFWFCVVTMSTVGYGDVYPITDAGRIVAGAFILFTLATVGLLITAVSEVVTEVRRMEENGLIGTRMSGHVVICGFNSMARAALVELLAARRSVAVLCETADELTHARDYKGGKASLFVTYGEPSQELFRDRLAVGAAEAVIVAMSDDTKNLIATLNVKAVNPNARLVVALQRDELRQTLIAGGVTYVASPNELSGRLVASAAFEPEVAHLIEDLMSSTVGSYDLQQYEAGKLGGLSIAEIRTRLNDIDGPLLVALAKRTGGSFQVLPHPPGATRVDEHDALLVLATDEQAERLHGKYGVKQGR